MIPLSELSKQEPAQIGDPEPKIRKLSDIVGETQETYEEYKKRKEKIAPEYKSPLGVRYRGGLSDSLRQMTYMDEGIKIMYGQAKMAVGGMLGKQETVERGRSLIQTMNRDIDQQEREAYEKRPLLSAEDMKSFGYMLGGGTANYGVMITGAYLTGGLSKLAGLSTKVAVGAAEATGLGENFIMEATGRLNQSLEWYKQRFNDPELKTLTPEVAGKNLAWNLIYATGSTILEKKFGFGEQVKLVKTPLLSAGKRVLMTSASEGGTEFVQGLLNIGIDLAEGQINWSKVPDEIKGAFMEGSVGAVLGGTAGIAAATAHRSTAKNAIKEYVKPFVPEDKLDVVADAIYESGNDSMSNVIAVELAQSSELRAKRGAVYDSFVNAAQQAMKDSGGYQGMSEDELGQLAVENANMFADQVLAEAHKRGVVVDDVIKASDIMYDAETKELRLAPMSVSEEQQKVRERKRKKKSPEEVKVKTDELKAQIEENAPAEEKEQNLNDVVSSYEGAENFDVEAMSTDEKQAVFEAEEAVKDSFTAPEETYDDSDNTSVDIAVKEGILAEQMEFLSTLSDYDKNRVLRTIIEKEHTEKDAEDVLNYAEELYNKTSYQGMSNLFWDIYLDPKASEKTKKKAKDIYDRIFNVTEQTETQEDVEEYDPTKEYNEYDVVKYKDKYLAYIDGDFQVYDTLEDARNNAETLKRVTEENQKYRAEQERKQEEKIAAQRNALLTGEGEVPMSYIIENLKSEGIWDGLGAKTKGNINAFEDYIVKFKDGEVVSGRLEYNGKRAGKRQTLVVNAQNAIKKLREKMQANQVTEETKEELSPETSEAIQENTLPEVEKEDTTTPDKIEDFGEYLYGARKDLWTGFKNKLNETLPEDAVNIKLSEVFPEPNYEKAIANGVDVNALAAIKALRDMIPTKPKREYRLRKWREMVFTMRNIASEIVNNNFDLSVMNDVLSQPKYANINNIVKMYQMLGYPYFTKAKGYAIEPVYYHEWRPGDWTLTNIFHEGDKEGFAVTFNGRYIRINDTYFLENANDGVEEVKRKLDIETKEKDKKVKFDIYYTENHDKVYVGKKVRSGKYLDLRTFNTVKEAREYLANNYDTLVEELNKLKQNPMDRGEVNEARVGEDYRNGSDATPEMFADMFGFRGVQFGNWVEQKTRIKDLNEAYDALVDLSKVLNIPTRAIALNGTLGLAFGARGHKGALAHYEPDTVVINLTKMKGAGSLAHEWFHALDNSFMKKENKQYEYATEWASEYNPLSHNRPEVMLAFMEVRKAIKNSGLVERAQEWDKWRSADYWSTVREMGARTFEQYVKDKLAEKGVSNDFLVNLISTEDEQNVYLNQDEKEPIYAAYDKLFNTLQTRETEKGVELYQGENKQGAKKGLFDSKSKVIKLFENADASTLSHELAHYWLDNMWTYAQSGLASEQYKAQLQAVKEFLGVKPEQEFLTRTQHEKFARAYEKYIYRGMIPNSMMGTVFDNYERFIRKVYDSIEDITHRPGKKLKLTPEIIKFFDSMLTGGVNVTALTEQVASEARNEEAQKADDVTMKEAKEVTDAMPDRIVAPEIAPVKVEGETKESRLYNRLKGVVGDKGTLEYSVANIEQQRNKAKEMWQSNPQKAQNILNGTESADDILRQALYTEQQSLALKNGDTNTFLNSVRKQSAEATRLGQEISALRGVAEDITDPAYWIRSAESEALKNLAKKQTKNLENAKGNTPLVELTSRLDADIKALQKDVLSKETDEEKTKAFKKGLKEIAEKYQGLNQPETVFNQVDWNNEDFANDYIDNKVKEKLGIALSTEKAKAFIQTARDLDALSKQRDNLGLPTEQFLAKKDELERMRNSHTPTARTKVLISTIGRANMLTAPATSVLNVVSNAQNYVLENLVRRVGNAIEGHTNDNIVSENLKDEYRAKVWKTFWDTGYDVSMMTSLLDERIYKGEKGGVSSSEGDGAIRAVGRFAEKWVFSRLISSPDVLFKSVLGFTNYVGNEATQVAYSEGLTCNAAVNRANELFKDAIKIEPETEQGQMIRNKSQTEALILTFQQDTMLSKTLTSIRTKINEGTGDIGIGDILSPFVKTPANIISMGFDASVGAFASPVNLIGALNDVKTGNIKSARVLQAVKQTTTAALAYTVLGLLVSMLIDDDDYIPDYAQLTESERNAARARNASFGSVKIGDTWVSTDFFGTLEMPLVVLLNTRRTNNLLKGIASGVGSKALDMPVLRDVIGSSDAVKELATEKDDIISLIGENVANASISRLTPNALNTIAKMIDNKERKANTIVDKLVSRIPFVRETLPERINVSTGKAQELGRVSTFLLGARGKTENKEALSREIGRLADVKQAVNISDPTKRGDLASLTDEQKTEAQNIFAREYYKKASRLIGKSSYQKKSDEAKKEALNDVKKDVIKDLKRKYSKQIKKVKANLKK